MKTIRPRWGVYEEPIEEFRVLAEINPLLEFYKDPERNALQFQLHTFFTSLQQQEQIIKDRRPVIVIERGVESSKIFAQALNTMDILSDASFWVLRDVYNRVRTPIDRSRYEQVFYLDVDLETALQRIKERNRREEIRGKPITERYLYTLRNAMLDHYPSGKLKMIDVGDMDPNQIAERVRSVLEFLRNCDILIYILTDRPPHRISHV